MKLIDADALYDIVIDSIKPMTTNEAIILQDFVALLEDAPTVDAEPVRHGHWEDSSNGWTCSICNRDVSRDYNYCPNCGAKMDKLTMVQVKPSDKEFTLYADEKPILTFKDGKIVLHGERREDANN